MTFEEKQKTWGPRKPEPLNDWERKALDKYYDEVKHDRYLDQNRVTDWKVDNELQGWLKMCGDMDMSDEAIRARSKDLSRGRW